ncbi:MAG TPA: class I SAM-dependent methyltransferase [Anaerolineales bacterium]|nr:class I SAM-dependent methyltransferase [Anaerolineales bacterium]
MGIDLHQGSIEKNYKYWNQKPILKILYGDFYRRIAAQLSNLPDSKIVELGSGLGNIREFIPNCIRTDLFPNPWIDQIENAYQLSFANETVSDLILTDVFHHLKYPGTALKEFSRVLRKGGRVIMLEPCISALGVLVYGALHDEPIAVAKQIEWEAPKGWSPEQIDYYAAQGNASRLFLGKRFHEKLGGWQTIKTQRLSAIAYAASGGFSKPQLYPSSALPFIRKLEKVLDLFPILFATRLLVILEK